MRRAKKKNIVNWTIFLAAFFLALGFIFFENDLFYRDFAEYFSSFAPPAPEVSPTRVTIDFGNGKRRAFEGEVERGTTAVLALRASEAAGGFHAVTDDHGRIVSIAGVKNDDGRKWRAYRNNAFVGDIPGNVEIGPGDRITFRYE